MVIYANKVGLILSSFPSCCFYLRASTVLGEKHQQKGKVALLQAQADAEYKLNFVFPNLRITAGVEYRRNNN